MSLKKEYQENVKEINKIIDTAEKEQLDKKDNKNIDYRFLEFPQVNLTLDFSNLNMEQIEKFDDEELVILAQFILYHTDWDNITFNLLFNELHKRYEPLMHYLKQKYYSNKGLDGSDYFAAGLKGFVELINYYKYTNDGEAAVKTFLWQCSSGKMSTLLKHADSDKYKNLNESESFDGTSTGSDLDASSRYAYLNTFKTDDTPEKALIEETLVYKILTQLKFLLTELEFQALYAEMMDYTYCEAAETLNISEKSVDNAIHRSRQKLKNYLKNQAVQRKRKFKKEREELEERGGIYG